MSPLLARGESVALGKGAVVVKAAVKVAVKVMVKVVVKVEKNVA